jgi:hypothetical protein
MESSNKNEKLYVKFNEMQCEILRIGWKGILENYHPDNNINQPDGFKIFQLYKDIYENMQKRLVIDNAACQDTETNESAN